MEPTTAGASFWRCPGPVPQPAVLIHVRPLTRLQAKTLPQANRNHEPEGTADSEEVGESPVGATGQARLLEFSRPPGVPLYFALCAIPGVAPIPGILIPVGFKPAGQDPSGNP